MIISNLKTFNFSVLFKLIFIIFIIVLFIVLYIIKKRSESPYKEEIENKISGIKINKNFATIFTVLGGVSNFAYYTVNYKRFLETEITKTKELEEANLKDILVAKKYDSLGEKTIYQQFISHLEAYFKNMITASKTVEKIITEQYIEDETEPNKTKLAYLKNKNFKFIDNNTESTRTTSEKLDIIRKIIGKNDNENNFITLESILNFNFLDLSYSLSNDQVGGIGLLLLSQVIIGSAISIVFIHFVNI